MNFITILKNSYMALIFFMLYLPIAFLIFLSFNNSNYSFLWQGFSWRWYEALLHNTDLQIVALRSGLIAFLSSSVATILGLFSAISFYRYRFLGKKFLLALMVILILSPDMIMGVGLLVFYTALEVPFGFWTLLLAHVTFCIPFAMITIYARLKGQGSHLIEAAQDLGASEWQLFKAVLVPLLSPAILVSWLLCFTLSLDDSMISFFVSGPEFEILPLRIFSLVRLGVKPEVNALCAVLFGITLILIVTFQMVNQKK